VTLLVDDERTKLSCVKILRPDVELEPSVVRTIGAAVRLRVSSVEMITSPVQMITSPVGSTPD
jgi:hypothetical protein